MMRVDLTEERGLPPSIESEPVASSRLVTFVGAASVMLWITAAPYSASAQPIEDAPLLEDVGGGDAVETPTETVGSGESKASADSNSVLVAEFGLEERNVVLSAAKTKTTIQEAPAIVSVITAEDIRSRGYRTINDVLQTVPGFEGDRWDNNGWTEESFARGTPRGLLVLLNGVNIIDPIRNTVSLDRKIPLEVVERIEVVSGPGGVLWGSNALLGVVNIITRDGSSFEGYEVIVGGGTGVGEREAGKVAASWGAKFFDDRVKVFSHLSFFTTRSADLTVDMQKVVGALPEPTNDSLTLYVPTERAAGDPASREYFFNFIGTASLGDLRLEWMVPFEQDYRQIGTGGAVLTEDLRADKTQPKFDLETGASDAIRLGAIHYQSRFLEDTFGVNAKAFFMKPDLKESPFGAFPASDVSTRVARGVATRFVDLGVYRTGLNLDMDLSLPYDNGLTFGGEVFREWTDGIKTTNPINAAQAAQLMTEPERGEVVYEDGQPFFREFAMFPAARTIGAVYIRDEFKANRDLAFSGGVRGQFSDTYDAALLLSVATVWNVVDDTYIKLNYAEGFRPPNWLATDVNGEAISGINYQPNPDLTVETSRAGEIEVNTVLFKGGKLVKRLYLRADYALTQLDAIIVQQGGIYTNSGQRLTNSVEVFGRLELKGGHEAWLGYYFVDADDAATGKLRQIANNVVNVGAKGMILENRWEVSTLLTWIGPREDRNRFVDPTRDPFFVDCPTAGARSCIPVNPTDVFYEFIDPVWLLRVGTRVLDLYDTFTLSAFGYNVLNKGYFEPNLFDDDRILTRPQAKPGWSFFVQGEARF